MIDIQRRAVAIRNLGLFPSALYTVQKLWHARPRDGKPFRLSSRFAKYPLHCRPNTSDIDVFSQIFVGREYRCLDDIRKADLIVDCGANVGFASAYLLTRYPEAQLIAVEPDPGNYAALQANLASYGSRCRTIRSGVWSHDIGLVLSDERFADGREWARTVRPARDTETASIAGMGIASLLRESGRSRISILKLDVEGSEAAIFSHNCQEWLEKVDNLVIELHGARCKSIFDQAIKHSGFVVSRCDELTVCKRVTSSRQRNDRSC
jgi:FkbM family methyltransferase